MPVIVPSSPEATGAVPKSFGNQKINLDYRDLNIGQSFQLDANEFKLTSLRMNVKRFLEKNPTFNLRVINHGKLIEVARIPLPVGTNKIVESSNEALQSNS